MNYFVEKNENVLINIEHVHLCKEIEPVDFKILQNMNYFNTRSVYYTFCIAVKLVLFLHR